MKKGCAAPSSKKSPKGKTQVPKFTTEKNRKVPKYGNTGGSGGAGGA